MAENYLNEFLRKEHEEAAKDANKGEEKDTKDMDDRIGYIHDALKRIEDYLGTNKLTKKEQMEAKKEGEKKEEEYNKEDEKESKDSKEEKEKEEDKGGD